MTASTGSSERDVIPRWRSVTRTILAGELSAPASSEPRTLAQSELDELDRRRLAWKAHGTETYAAEFVASAVVLGVPHIAAEAVEFLSRDGDDGSLGALLRAARDPRTNEAQSPFPVTQFSEAQARQEIAAQKAAIRRDPRNPIAWSELARNYAALGMRDRAKRAIRNALSLAPTSRYLLRSTACFFVATGAADKAHDLIASADPSGHDPWLVAAELATASAAGKKPRLAKRGRSIIDSGALRPLDLSELASELGTLELNAGGDKRARRLFEQALIEPTENSLAQVEWASHRMTGIVVPETNLARPEAFEARARHAHDAGHWREALVNAQNWSGDQPLSRDAAIYASYSAAVGLQDWDTSVAAAEGGLRAHPRDPVLLNNVAYALIELGRLTEAEGYLDKSPTITNADGVALVATRGLLAYRSGRVDEGRNLYRRAMALARTNRRPELEAMAEIMYAREEVSIASPESADAVARAAAAGERIALPAIHLWLKILKQLHGGHD